MRNSTPFTGFNMKLSSIVLLFYLLLESAAIVYYSLRCHRVGHFASAGNDSQTKQSCEAMQTTIFSLLGGWCGSYLFYIVQGTHIHHRVALGADTRSSLWNGFIIFLLLMDAESYDSTL